MNSKEQARFDALYQQHLTELKLQGIAPMTIDAHSGPVRRISSLFVFCCPVQLTQSQLKTFFASLVDSHSWSTVKLGRNGLQLFYHYVPDKQWEWVRIFKPPQVSQPAGYPDTGRNLETDQYHPQTALPGIFPDRL